LLGVRTLESDRDLGDDEGVQPRFKRAATLEHSPAVTFYPQATPHIAFPRFHVGSRRQPYRSIQPEWVPPAFHAGYGSLLPVMAMSPPFPYFNMFNVNGAMPSLPPPRAPSAATATSRIQCFNPRFAPPLLHNMSAMTLNPFPAFSPRHISPAFGSYIQSCPPSGVNAFLSYPAEARPNVGPFSSFAAFPEQMQTLPDYIDATLPRGDEGEQQPPDSDGNGTRGV